MDFLSSSLKIVFFLLFMIFLFAIAEKEQNFNISYNIFGKKYYKDGKIRFFVCIFLSSALGFYSIICGRSTHSDRSNFAERFTQGLYKKAGSDGLMYFEKIIGSISNDCYFFFFTITFISVLLVILAYNFAPERSPVALLFMGAMQVFFYCFYQFKQAPANAFVALSVYAFFKKKNMLGVIFLLLAVLFHESALFAIPVILLMKFSEKKSIWACVIISSIIFCAAFSYSSRLILNICKYVPGFEAQIRLYLNPSGGIRVEDINYFTVFKRAPLYSLMIISAIYRRTLKKKIRFYYQYMMITFFACISSVTSMYMYWMFRFGELFYIPICIFASLIYKNLNGRSNKLIFLISFFGVNAFVSFRALCQYFYLYGGF